MPIFRYLLVILFLGGTRWAVAQSNDTIYFTADGKVTPPASASFYSTITREGYDTARFAVQTFSASGNLMASGTYQGRTFPVAWGKLYDPSFRDALKDSTFREYYETRQLKFEGSYQDGKGQGRHRRWYENGQLLSQGTLVAGEYEGTVATYYENGQPKIQYGTRNGRLEGELVEYYENGKKKQKALFRNGVMQGEIILFDPEENEITPEEKETPSTN